MRNSNPFYRWLANRRMAVKFAYLAGLIGLALFSLAIPLVKMDLDMIAVTEMELGGTACARDVFELMHEVETYRDALQADNVSALKNSAGNVERELGEIAAWIEKNSVAFGGSRAQMNKLNQYWQQVHQPDGEPPRPEQARAIFAEFNVLAVDLLQDIGEDAKLSLDPTAPLYHLYEAIFLQLAPMLEAIYLLENSTESAENDQELSIAEVAAMSGWQSASASHLKPLERALRLAEFNQLSSHEPVRVILTALSESLTQQELLSQDGRHIAQTIHGMGVRAHHAHDIAQALTEELNQTLSNRLQERILRVRNTLLKQLLLMSLPLAALLYIGRALYLSIKNGVDLIRAGTARIAQGDLTYQISIPGSDEMSMIGAAINEQREAFRKLLTGVVDSTYAVQTAAQSFARVAGEVAEVAQETTHSAARVFSSVEKVSSGIAEIAAASTAAHSDTQLAEQSAHQGGQVIHETVEQVGVIAREVTNAAEALARLHAESSQISRVVVLIREIANQTNLLALNAAIEAARAGESGRGFAVVADEVRLLAGRAAQATQEIDQAIDRVMTISEEAQRIIGAGVEQLAVVQGLSGQVSEVVASILKATSRSEIAVEQIRRQLNEQRELADTITLGVKKIADRSGTNSSAVELAQQSAHVLMAIADDLKTHMTAFRISQDPVESKRPKDSIDLF